MENLKTKPSNRCANMQAIWSDHQSNCESSRCQPGVPFNDHIRKLAPFKDRNLILSLYSNQWSITCFSSPFFIYYFYFSLERAFLPMTLSTDAPQISLGRGEGRRLTHPEQATEVHQAPKGQHVVKYKHYFSTPTVGKLALQ